MGDLNDRFRVARLVLATILELDPRPDNQILYSPGDQDISGTGQGCHPGSDVDRQSTKIIASHLALAGMQPHPQSHIELLGGFVDRLSTADSSGGAIK